MEAQDIPDSAIRAVSNKLRHYIDVQRREEGFDSSPPSNLTGNFSSSRGTAGTFHYNSLQDRHLQHYYQQPLVRRQLIEAGVIHPGMIRDVRQRSRSAGQQQRHSAKMESDVLLTTAARLLISSSYCSSAEGIKSKSSSRRTQSVRASSSRPSSSHTRTHSTQSVIRTPEATTTSSTVCAHLGPPTPPRRTHPPTPPRPVVRCSVAVNTLNTSEACTQTPVNVSTQTHLSKVSKSKRRTQRHEKLKTKDTYPVTIDCDS